MTTTLSSPQALQGKARGSFPIAPQGWPFIIGTLALLLVSYALSWTYVTIIFAILFALVLNFFRDFERAVPQGDDIFMNVFDVHVNRPRMSGTIRKIEYIPGKFVNASFDNVSTENERQRFEMQTDNSMTLQFTQISGLIARRIISYVSKGEHVQAGQRIGMIRFGSRVNCDIPAGSELNVKMGDKVSAVSTILARKVELTSDE